MPIKITMPALSPTMTEGNLAKWLKKEGDTVKAGDVIAEIETDKATMEVEAVDEGILGKILVPAGTEKVPVNDVIGLLLEEGESKDALKDASSASQKKVEPVKDLKPSPRLPSASLPLPQGEGDRAQARSGEGLRSRIYASPLAKRIAKERGVDLSQVKGSGPHGRVVRADVENARPGAGGAAPKPQGPDAKKLADLLGMKYTEIPNNNIKKIVASRLLESKMTVPHFYLTIDCMLDSLLESRKELNDKAGGAYKLSVNDFVIKAAAMALKAYPAANVAWTDAAILQYEHADISVAVATPNGLITPVIKKAEEKGMQQISTEMKDLATRARDGKLKPEEFQGGTFSISNLGMFGIKDFQAIINPPQACILAVGAGIEKPVVENGEIKIRTVMSCTLSVDHRAVDGAIGAEYLQYFKKYIENPVTMLL
ncbi:MAG: pyruvate dehydrogenase complex dihydrolipoamide acetyltransferase [Alphaproteobacteria bacterium]|jgi:pyruvate dehydrogenase E2 component (dihydrolipoamide acetyltransferase)|nr:pyruvate dehydrogenase complex dihydrolipoamide acetyltransferase [Alphaproteobacteria bacterium]